MSVREIVQIWRRLESQQAVLKHVTTADAT